MTPVNYFDIFRGTNNQWYWNLHNGGNHAIIATGGEGFESHSNALRAVKNFRHDVDYAFVPGEATTPPTMAMDDILADVDEDPEEPGLPSGDVDEDEPEQGIRDSENG